MLTSQQILDLATAPPTGMTHGRALSVAQRESRTMTSAQRQFLSDVQSTPARRSTTTAYDHPGTPPLPFRENRQPLTASELAWINRLPTDPAQVSHDDARVLASMSASLSPQHNTADRRLVDQTWVPVRDIHDRAQASTRIDDAEKNTPAPVPASAHSALTDAIAAETPALQQHEAAARARQLLDNAAARSRDNHQSQLAIARDRRDTLDAAIQQRSAVTR